MKKIDGTTFEYKPVNQGEFRFRELGGYYLVTESAGHYSYLTREEFADFAAGRLDPDSGKARELRIKNLMLTGDSPGLMTFNFAHKNAFLSRGTGLHIVIPTIRCDLKCSYCQASAGSKDATGLDMDLSTAKQVVDTIFKTENPGIVIEFQGGEPLLNF